MTVLGGAFKDFDTAYLELSQIIKSGKAVEKFKELVRIQGGNPEIVDNPSMLPQSKYHSEVKASESGYVSAIDAERIGITAMLLGAGRQKKGDRIDFSAGVTMVKKVGDKVNVGDVLCILHTNMEDQQEVSEASKKAYSFSDMKPKPSKYIYKIIQ